VLEKVVMGWTYSPMEEERDVWALDPAVRLIMSWHYCVKKDIREGNLYNI
jgi:hypothetical protein